MTTFTYDFRDSLEELRSRLTWRLGFVLIGFGILGAWYLLLRRDVPVTASGYIALLIILGRVSQILVDKNPVLARHVLVWGTTVHILLAMLLFPNSWLPWFSIVCVFVDAMLINSGGLFTGSIVFGLALLLNVTGVRAYFLLELVGMLILSAMTSWLSAYTLFTAVHWYRAMQARSDELLNLTRDHRAQLSQTLKSLEAAYETQRHIQMELIRARKHAEDARRLKEQFAANISHELRTPLNLILGFSEIMYLSPDVYGDVNWSPTLRRDIHQIYRSSQHLLSLIDDILDLSRFEMTGFGLNIEVTSLEPLLSDTIEIAKDLVRGRPVELNKVISNDIPALEIDSTRIRQVILNLLNNACRFTENGTIELRAVKRGCEVHISVNDTGPGIPADKLPYIFDEFYQVNYSLKRSHSGAGLGLAICKHFVESHGGRIWVESQENVGSQFTFSLPILERLPTTSSNTGSESHTISEWSRRCVLVLEKDSSIISMLRRYLKDCDVVQVRDKASLQEMVVTCHPQAVILNVQPGQREALVYDLDEASVPVIECSLSSLTWIAESPIITGFLTKPISAETLLNEIEQINHVQNILVVDDDRGFTLLVEGMLKASDNHLEVQRAYDGVQALAMMRSHPPDVVILDVSMQDIDGFAVLKCMKEEANLAAIPVILLTANSSTQELHLRSEFVVRHQDGLYPIEIINCIQAVLPGLKPRYYNPKE